MILSPFMYVSIQTTQVYASLLTNCSSMIHSDKFVFDETVVDGLELAVLCSLVFDGTGTFKTPFRRIS